MHQTPAHTRSEADANRYMRDAGKPAPQAQVMTRRCQSEPVRVRYR